MDEARPRLHFSWWWVVIASLALTVIALTIWYRSDRDLHAVEARAKALGITATWAEAGLQLSDQRLLDDWRRLGTLAEALTSYADANNSLSSLKPGMPVPEGMRAHHAALDPVALAEALAICQALRADSLVDVIDPDIFRTLPALSWGRQLSRLLCERMALAPTHLVVDEARLHLQAIAAEPPRTLIQALVAISRLALWQQSLTLRLHDPGLDRAGLATLADHARLWLDAAMGRCWIGEYRWMLHMTERIRRGEPKYSDALVGDFGLGLPSWTKPLGLHLLVYRSARSGILMGVLDIQQAWVRNPAPSHRYADMKNLDRVWSSVPAWDLRHRFERLLLPAVGMVGRSWAEADTHLRLLAAELRGEPWPIDPTDPAGKPVRRIERDGRLIGFYLLKDGTDDGGHTSKDKCTALYEPLGKPMAADPLVSDPP